jgi:hypothetical protein
VCTVLEVKKVDGGKCCSVLVDSSVSCAWVLDLPSLVGGVAGVAV